MKYLAAVCEDDARLARELAGECSRLLSSRGVEAHVDVFASAEELRSGLGKYRLLILDIELPGENGLSLARRARAAGSKAAVIFVTGCAEYALEGYDVQPVHYLVKPVDEARLADAIDRALAYSGAPETIVLRVGNRIVSLDAGDVWYIESLNRELIVHGSEGEQNFAMTLSAACEALPPGRFAHCHNSFAVNLSEVAEIGRTELRLRSGAVLPIGRKFYRDFQRTFIRYVNKS